ncbi:hypothetical protein QYM36_014618, partial [Artemia franciscana]
MVGQEDSMTAREALLRWAQKTTAKYPGVRVGDFTNSWKDGLAFNAIIHRNRPDLVEWRTIRNRAIRERLDSAFNVLEKEYAVTRLLDPEDVDTPEPDEKSLITYISSVYDVFPEPPVIHPLYDPETQRKYNDYRELSRVLMSWIRHSVAVMQDRDFPPTLIEMKKLADESNRFRNEEVPSRLKEKQALFQMFKDIEQFLEETGEYLEPDLRPDSIERHWNQMLTLHQERKVAIQDEIVRLERLQRIAEKVHRDAKQVEVKLGNLEQQIEEEAQKIYRAHPADVKRNCDLINQEVDALDDVIKSMFGDVQMLKDGRHNQAAEMHKRVQRIHQRWLSLRTMFQSRLVSILSTLDESRMSRSTLESRLFETNEHFRHLRDCTEWVKSKLKVIEEAEYGTDLPGVQVELEEHVKEQKAIERFQPAIDKCSQGRNAFSGEDLQIYTTHLTYMLKLHSELLSNSSKRLSDLNILLDFMQSATNELIWLNEKEEIEVNRDWSAKGLDIQEIENYYEALMPELEKREIQFTAVQDRGESLLLQHHPASKTIEAYLAAMQTQWSWVLQLTLCLEIHLRQATIYQTFFAEIKECEQWVQQQDQLLNTTFSQSEFSLDEGERLLREMQILREDLARYGDMVQALVERSAIVPPLRLRKHAVRQPLAVEAICNYDSVSTSISKGEQCKLLDNVQKTKWRIVNSSGAEGLVPGVCFFIPPPDAEALDGAEKLKRQYDRCVALWQKKQLRMRQNMIFATIKVVRSWDLQQFLAMGKEQRDAIRKALNEDAGKLMSEGDPTDPQLKRLAKEMAEVNRLFDDFERRAAEGEGTVLNINEQLASLENVLDDADQTLQAKMAAPVPRDMDTLETLVIEHRVFETELQKIDGELNEIKVIFSQQPRKTTNTQQRIDSCSQTFDRVWQTSRIYIERLKCVEIVLNGLEEATTVVSEIEIKLAAYDKMPSTIDSLKKVHEDLADVQSSIQVQQPVIDQLNDDMQTTRRLVEKSRVGLQSARATLKRHPDVDRLEADVSQVTVRWANVCSQVAERLQSVEVAGELLDKYNVQAQNNREWLNGIEQQVVNGYAGELFNGAIERKQHIEDMNAAGGRLLREAKIFDIRLSHYKQSLEEIQPSLDGVLSPQKKQKVDSCAESVSQDLDEINGRYKGLLDKLMKRLDDEFGETSQTIIGDKSEALNFQTFRTELNIPDNVDIEDLDDEEMISGSFQFPSRSWRMSSSSESGLHTSISSVRLNQTSITSLGSSTIINGADSKFDSHSEHSFDTNITEENIDRARTVYDATTKESLTLSQAVEAKIIDLRTGEYCDQVTGKCMSLKRAAAIGLLSQSLLQLIDKQKSEVMLKTPKISAVKNKVSVVAAILSGDINSVGEININAQVYTVSEAYRRGYLKLSLPPPYDGYCLSEAIEQNLIDTNSGQFLDRNTDKFIPISDAIKLKYINPNIREVVHSNAKSRVTLNDAVKKGVLDIKNGLFLNTKTGDSFSFIEAAKKKFVSRPITLKDCVDQGYLTGDSDSFKDPFFGGNLTVITAVKNGLLDPYLKTVKNTLTGEYVSLEEAVATGIILYNCRFVDMVSKEQLPLWKAVECGYLASVKLHTVFEIEGFKNAKTGDFVDFKSAVDFGIIDLKLGCVCDISVGRNMSLVDAVDAGIVQRSVCDVLSRNIGMEDRYGVEMTVFEAVAEGCLDYKHGRICHAETRQFISLDEAIKMKIITSEGASVLRSILNLAVSVFTIIETTETVERYAESVTEKVVVNSSLISEETLVRKSPSPSKSPSRKFSQYEYMEQGLEIDTVDTTSLKRGEQELCEEASKVASCIQSLSEDTADGAINVTITSAATDFNLNLKRTDCTNDKFHLQRTNSRRKLVTIPPNGLSLQSAINDFIVDPTTGIILPPNSDAPIPLITALETRLIDPSSGYVLDRSTNSYVDLLSAAKSRLLSDAAEYEHMGSILSLKEAVIRLFVRFNPLETVNETTSVSLSVDQLKEQREGVVVEGSSLSNISSIESTLKIEATKGVSLATTTIPVNKNEAVTGANKMSGSPTKEKRLSFSPETETLEGMKGEKRMEVVEKNTGEEKFKSQLSETYPEEPPSLTRSDSMAFPANYQEPIEISKGAVFQPSTGKLIVNDVEMDLFYAISQNKIPATKVKFYDQQLDKEFSISEAVRKGIISKETGNIKLKEGFLSFPDAIKAGLVLVVGVPLSQKVDDDGEEEIKLQDPKTGEEYSLEEAIYRGIISAEVAEKYVKQKRRSSLDKLPDEVLAAIFIKDLKGDKEVSVKEAIAAGLTTEQEIADLIEEKIQQIQVMKKLDRKKSLSELTKERLTLIPQFTLPESETSYTGKVKRKVAKILEAANLGLIDLDTAKLIDEAEIPEKLIEDGKLNPFSGAIRNVNTGNILTVIEAIDAGILDLSSKSVSTPVGRFLSLNEAFEVGLYDTDKKRLIHPESGRFISVTEAMNMEIIDPNSTFIEPRNFVEMSLREGVERDLVNKKTGEVSSREGLLSVPDAVERKLFNANSNASDEYPKIAPSLSLALNLGLITEDIKYFNKNTKKTMEISTAFNKGYLMSTIQPNIHNGIELQTAIKDKLIDVKTRSLVLPQSKVPISVYEAIESGILRLPPQQPHCYPPVSNPLALAEVQIDNIIESVENINPEFIKLLPGFELLDKSQVKCGKTSKIITIELARKFGIVENLEPSEVDLLGCFVSGLVTADGMLIHPVTGVCTAIADAINSQMVSYPVPENCSIVPFKDNWSNDVTNLLVFDINTQQILTVGQLQDKDMSSETPEKVKEAIQRGSIIPAGVLKFKEPEKTLTRRESLLGGSVEHLPLQRRISLSNALALPLVRQTSVKVGDKTVTIESGFEEGIVSEDSVIVVNENGETFIEDFKDYLINVRQLLSAEEASLHSFYDFREKYFQDPSTRDFITFSSFLAQNVVDSEFLVVKDLRVNKFIPIKSGLDETLISSDFGEMKNPKDGSTVEFYEAVKKGWVKIQPFTNLNSESSSEELYKVYEPKTKHVIVEGESVHLATAISKGLIPIENFNVVKNRSSKPLIQSLSSDSQNKYLIIDDIHYELQEAINLGLVRPKSHPLTIEAAYERGLLDNNGTIFDPFTGNMINIPDALDSCILDSYATLIKHPSSGYFMTLAEAVDESIVHDGKIRTTSGYLSVEEGLKSGIIYSSVKSIRLEDALSSPLFNKRTDKFNNIYNGRFESLNEAILSGLVDVKDLIVETNGAEEELRTAIVSNTARIEGIKIVIQEEIHEITEIFEKGKLKRKPKQITIQDAIRTGLYSPKSGLLTITDETLTIQEALRREVVLDGPFLKDTRTGEILTVSQAIHTGILNPFSGQYIDPATGSEMNLFESLEKGLLVKSERRCSLPRSVSVGVYEPNLGKIIEENTAYAVKYAEKQGLVDKSKTLFTDPNSGAVLSYDQAVDCGLLDAQKGKICISKDTYIDLAAAVEQNLMFEISLPLPLTTAILLKVFNPETSSFLNPNTGRSVSLLEAIELKLIDSDSVHVVDTEHGFLKKRSLLDAINSGVVKSDSSNVMDFRNGKELPLEEALQSGLIIDSRGAISLQKMLSRGFYDEQSGLILDPNTGKDITLHEAMRRLVVNPALPVYFNPETKELLSLVEACRLGIIDRRSGKMFPYNFKSSISLLKAFNDGVIIDVEKPLTLYEALSLSLYNPLTGLFIHPITGQQITLQEAITSQLIDASKSVLRLPNARKYLSLSESLKINLIDPIRGRYNAPNESYDTINFLEAKMKGYIVNSRKPMSLLEVVLNDLVLQETGKIIDPLVGDQLPLDLSIEHGLVEPLTTLYTAPNKSLQAAINDGCVDAAKAKVFDPNSGGSLSISQAFDCGLLKHVGNPISFSEGIDNGLVNLKTFRLSDPRTESEYSLEDAIRSELIDPETAVVRHPTSGNYITLRTAIKEEMVDLQRKAVINPVTGKLGSLCVFFDQGSIVFMRSPLTFTSAIEKGHLNLDNGKLEDPVSKEIISLKEGIKQGILDPHTAIVKDTKNKRLLTLDMALAGGILDSDKGMVLNTEDNRLLTMFEAVESGFILTPGCAISLIEAIELEVYDVISEKFVCPYTKQLFSFEEAVSQKLVCLSSTMVRISKEESPLTLQTVLSLGILSPENGSIRNQDGNWLKLNEALAQGLLVSADARLAVEEKYRSCAENLTNLVSWL